MFFSTKLMHRIKSCYDIRDINITKKDAFLIGQAFGSQLAKLEKNKVIVGYDRRVNSKMLSHNFIKGLISTGMHVKCIGQVTTAACQIAEIALKMDASVCITASHNPAQYHGFKFFVNKYAFADINLRKLVEIIIKKNFQIGKGSMQDINFKKDYAKLLQNAIELKGEFKIGWDFLNGSAGDVFPYIKDVFKGSHYILNHNLDHEFSGFAPDPTFEPRLDKLKELIKAEKLDFGIALDGDADRCVVIDKNFNLISGEALLALLAYFEYKVTNSSPKIICDSKMSNSLVRWVKKFGDCIVSSTGHSNIQHALLKNDGVIAGESSGHYMFKDFFCVNDGIYSALKFISYLEKLSLTLEEALKLLPHVWVLEQKNIPCKEHEKEEILQKIKNTAQTLSLTIDDKDGVKIDYTYGWWMIRASNTEECLRISGEGSNEEGLDKIKSDLYNMLSNVGL